MRLICGPCVLVMCVGLASAQPHDTPPPFAHVLPASATHTVDRLQRLGVRVDELREQVEADAEVVRHAGVTRPAATVRVEPRRLEPGMFVIRADRVFTPWASALLAPGVPAARAARQAGADFALLRLRTPTPLLTVAARAPEKDRPPPRLLTFEDIQGPNAANLTGSPTGGHEWLDDGEHFRQSREGMLRTFAARTGRVVASIDTGPAARALAALPAIGEKAATAVAGRARWNDDRTAFFAEHENDLYYATLDGARALRLTSTPEAEELASFSPDGAFVAFVRNNDLWTVDVATGTERALTTGGHDRLRRGKADWVYFEEIFGRSWKVYWWSPDSTRLAYLEIDSSPVPNYVIVNNARLDQRLENTPYPKAGEPNPRAKVFTVTAAGGTPIEMDLSAYEPDNRLVTRVFWRPDSSGVVACVTNRVQTWMDLVAAPAAGGAAKVLFRETTGAWIDESPTLRFLKDGTFLFGSERTGWLHLYRYDANGTLLNAVTSGEWECRSIARVDEAEGVAYVTGTKDNPLGENLYRVKLDGTEITRLTHEPGAHRVAVAPKGDLFVDTWSSRERPGQVALRSLTDGAVVRVLDTNPVRDLEKFRLGESTHFQIMTPDGFALEATLVKPPDFDPDRTYPVWFMTYAGPHAPTISDTWNGAGPARTWDQALASAGILAFRADPRSASGKGAVSAWACYKQLGQSELRDIETAITWLTAHPWADATRVGMAGHSYGGYITAYCMTRSTLFAAGIAGAPVTDWREYDSIYTERYMLTPRENPDGYRDGSVIEHAKDLHGRLLLVHGMMDDNVHLQNNTRLIKALQEANKPFEMMLYPEARHGIGGRHYQQVQIEFILRTMLGQAAPAPRETVPPSDGERRRQRN